MYFVMDAFSLLL